MPDVPLRVLIADDEPLAAERLQLLLAKIEGIDLVGQTFGYRLVSPMVGPQTLRIVPGQDGLDRGAESRSEAGAICAVSTVTEAVPAAG